MFVATLGLDPIPASEPRIEWKRVFGSTGNEFEGRIAVDPCGNVYAVGYTLGEFPGYKNAGGQDTWLVKFNSCGQHLWSRQWGTKDNDAGVDVAVDPCGHPYVAETISGGNSSQAILHKFSPDGRKLWSRHISVSGATAEGLAISDRFEVFITGGAPRPNTERPNTERVAYVQQFDSEGRERWTQLIGTANKDTSVISHAIAVDHCGNSFVAGSANGPLNGQEANGNSDAFVTKLDTFGRHVWTRLDGSKVLELARAVTVDECGDVLIAGEYATPEGVSDGDPAKTIDSKSERPEAGLGSATFITKFSTHGVWQWRSTPQLPGAARGIVQRNGMILLTGFGFAARLDACGKHRKWVIELPFGTKGIGVDSCGYLYVGGNCDKLNGQRPIGGKDAYLMKLVP